MSCWVSELPMLPSTVLGCSCFDPKCKSRLRKSPKVHKEQSAEIYNAISPSFKTQLKMFPRLIWRPLLAKVKETTGIVGLDVVPNAREVLIGFYTKTLKEIQAVTEDEGYRKELIEEARDELILIGKMIEWDPWGVPDDYECEVIENDAPVPKHVPLHRPGPLPEEFYKTLEAVSKKDEPKSHPESCR
ncbi:putative NADH dehydrogenase 1 alpha subcomplex subunit 5 [Hibiscus syriacus]|uniref:NADH dehydrogenase 1 alpha subcomplex subunit 5 n=1 Tax=Hibiscus syriacus TaxID=106335 RepID=A0A6A3A9H2_HIBSY|nr:putative NADH dehydrogenase 1 alpha subcomplex subunit 5 [Hibiscus syriacus]